MFMLWYKNTEIILNLFRTPGPASAGRRGLYILLLYFFSLFFSLAIVWRESAHQAPANTTNSVALGVAYTRSTDIRPTLPSPFLQGAKCPKFWPKVWPQSSSDRRIFELFSQFAPYSSQRVTQKGERHKIWQGWLCRWRESIR